MKLYSTGCDRCNILKTKLISKGIEFEEITDAETIASKGIIFVPVLEVDGELLNFSKANDYINTL